MWFRFYRCLKLQGELKILCPISFSMIAYIPDINIPEIVIYRDKHMKPTSNNHKLSPLHFIFYMILQNICRFFCSFRKFWELLVRNVKLGQKKNMENIVYWQIFINLRRLGQTNFYFSINLTEFCIQENLDFNVRTAANLKKNVIHFSTEETNLWFF